MKKTYLALMAIAAIALTGCKESIGEPEPTPWDKYKPLDVRKNGKVFVRSGAGIVADSVPENEYVECINKAAAVTKAIKEAMNEL